MSDLLSKFHPRQAADEKELFLLWRRDQDKDAHEALIERYTPLCRSLARRYGRSTEPFDDLFQVAQLGLLKALKRFDPERGFPFQAFAVPTVLGEMRRYFRDSGWAVHVPRGTQERALEVREAQHQLSEDHGRAPTVAQLCEYLELEPEQVLDGLRALAGYGTLSLDAPRHGEDEDGGSYAESIGDEDARYELVELGLSVATALEQLSPEQRELLRLRYVEDLTQTQIAARIGISQMQVSRLLRRCLEKLRALSEASEGAPEIEQASAAKAELPLASGAELATRT
ncbi:MAG TPA: SigB/SigF/SigG family RNA polymerase sigma factor [Solirubrobacteraceae bacterium]|jgi:RNA polymerase sigma-B factor|nr:SigB/SigF/SigG family RNA polymerase sigma factor [Solirubrobacteraceae bacterium]